MQNSKLLSISATALKSNFTKLDKPYKINFCITYLCQSRCETCNIWEIKPKNELTIDEIRQFASKASYLKWVELTGGEPFLRSDIVDIAKAFKDSCKDLYILTIPTNSLCNHDAVIKKIISILEMGIPRVAITVSLDGYKELHDKIRGIPGNYEKAINIFKLLKELKSKYKNLFLIFGYTISKFNIGKFEETFAAVKKDIPDITYNDFHVNMAQLSDVYYGNKELDITPSSNEIASEITKIIKSRSFELGAIPLIENTYLKRLVYYAETGKTPMKSRGLDASLFLDSWGNVFPSIMWDRKIGNIREVDYDLQRLWSSEAANKARKEMEEGKDPSYWTSCEAYQSITGNIKSILF